MWKILVGFVLFAVLAVFVLMKGGDIDMSGEKHGDTLHTEEPAKEAASPSSTGSMPEAKPAEVQASAAETAASAMPK
jgi:hypothetical protein